MSWVETDSPHFHARHDVGDDDDVARLLGQLESTRARLEDVVQVLPETVDVVVHPTTASLHLAQPHLVVLRRFIAPAARRYLVGGLGSEELHVLAPRQLRTRASAVSGSMDTVMLAPAALYVRLVLGANNPLLPPPLRGRRLVRSLRWAWLIEGTAQWLSGQLPSARPAIARRLHEGPHPSFPPGLRDANLLGGTVVDLLVSREGVASAVALACTLHPGGPMAGLRHAFREPDLRVIEGEWRTHLARLATSGH